MKTRAILTILISLITGFAIGFITSSQITKMRTRDIHSMSSIDAFKARAFSVIEPTPEQKSLIMPIVEEYALKSDTLRKQASREFHGLMDEFHSKLQPYLSDVQMERLHNFPKYVKKKYKHH
ncbi:MAG TPA: hypothetical protein VE870_00630 [Bacteroidales bacterium]|nr:hypothetical protein [Bacteroidales bacterium]